MNLKYQLQHGSMNLNYLVDNTQFQIFKIFQKKHDKITTNPPMQIYLNKVNNRTTFKINTRHVLALLIPEAIKLLESNGKKFIKT